MPHPKLRLPAFSTLMLLGLGLAGCGGDGGFPGYACPAIAAADFAITITDAITSARICDATVTAQDSATGESVALMAAGGASDCSYSGGFYERPGTFTISAAKSGYVSASKAGVVVTKGTCNVVAAQVAIALSH